MFTFMVCKTTLSSKNMAKIRRPPARRYWTRVNKWFKYILCHTLTFRYTL